MGEQAWKTARATNCSSLRVSWCQSFLWYRSARELYHSASSGWAARSDSRYCKAAMAIEWICETLFRPSLYLNPPKPLSLFALFLLLKETNRHGRGFSIRVHHFVWTTRISTRFGTQSEVIILFHLYFKLNNNNNYNK